MGAQSRKYYLKPVKVIRDLVHGYVNLTKFDLTLIDTVPFQRLSDVRQLTCQHVYPAARHTRFEHSLGVQELMRNAVKRLNENGVLGTASGRQPERVIDESLEFNASVAALLHDVGHCPYSHMGEEEFDKEQVQQALIREVTQLFDELRGTKRLNIKPRRPAPGKLLRGVPDPGAARLVHKEFLRRLRGSREKLRQTSYPDLIKKLKQGGSIGAVHEQLSCVVILRKYKGALLRLAEPPQDEQDACGLQTDFELIIRSILGIEYDVSTLEKFQQRKEKNVIVRLLNSKVFDVDKLDYIMRDSYLTGIGGPKIDTQRLFRNMYLDEKYSIVFTSRAVPALQNMIDARDGLYSYVYNHHAVVYSDFLNTYISRRLSHNCTAFYQAVYPTIREKATLEQLQAEEGFISRFGLVPKSYLFSTGAVVEEHHSDSAWLSLLNIINIRYESIRASAQTADRGRQKALIQEQLKLELVGELSSLAPYSDPYQRETVTDEDGQPVLVPKRHLPISEFEAGTLNRLSSKVATAMELVHQCLAREYLKPWWKTVFEYSNFMHHYFQDDYVRGQVGKLICSGGQYGLKADEMRSQIAKHVIYITQRLDEEEEGARLGLCKRLDEGDFFLVQRSPRFFTPDTIKRLEIALKSNEILGPPRDISRQVNDYYIKSLTNVIPQKDYSSIYAEHGFYIFSRKLTDADTSDPGRKKQHYKLLEKIFAFVAREFVRGGEQRFVSIYQDKSRPDQDIEDAMGEMYGRFKEWHQQ